MRPDGREREELRSIEIEAGVLERADGSAMIKWGVEYYIVQTNEKEDTLKKLAEDYTIALVEKGKVGVPKPLYDQIDISGEVVGSYFKGNIAVVAVFGPREPIPRHIADPYEAVVRFRYTMAPFSVPERKSPKPSRREIEISKVCKEVLQGAIFANEYPMTVVDVFAEILASDAGTRVAAITAASVALADAGIPMKDIVAALSVGRAYGEIVADLNRKEEDAPDAVDVPVAVHPRTEEIALIQMDGRVTVKEMDEIVELAIKKAKEINTIQKDALRKKYERVMEYE